jgi:ribosomal protein S18 acetylase RimI-like enzyme
MSTIRPAERRDVPRIVALWSALMENGRRADPRWMASAAAPGILTKWAWSSWIERDPFPEVWVAEVDGEVVGFIEGSVQIASRLVEMPSLAVIHSAWVEPAHRRKGLGRALVEAFVGAAQASGTRVVEVSTLALDGPANAFWRGVGFGDWRVTLRRDLLPPPG